MPNISLARTLSLVSFSFLLLSVHAVAQQQTVDVTGKGMLSGCNKAIKILEGAGGQSIPLRDMVEGTYWIGYIAGFNRMNGVVSSDSRVFCPPEGVTTEQSIRVARKFLQDDPANLHLNAGILLLMAMMSAFPCN